MSSYVKPIPANKVEMALGRIFVSIFNILPSFITYHIMCCECLVLEIFMVHGVNIFFVITCEQVELWFSGQQELENPQDPDVPPVFDRQGKLKNVSYTYTLCVLQ